MDNDFVKNFNDFMVTEGRVVIKRKYTEAHPEKRISDAAPVRERVLSFVKQRGSVTHDQLMEFFRALNEETGGTTSRKWLNKNTEYFTVKEEKGVKKYYLSETGKKVHDAIMKQKSV